RVGRVAARALQGQPRLGQAPARDRRRRRPALGDRQGPAPHAARAVHPVTFGVFSEEQEEFRSGVRRFLADKSPETEVRRLMETDSGYDPAVWRQMSEQLALQGLIVPERFGGGGFGYVELTTVMEEMGAALLCAPYFASVVLGAGAVMACGDDDAQA